MATLGLSAILKYTHARVTAILSPVHMHMFPPIKVAHIVMLVTHKKV